MGSNPLRKCKDCGLEAYDETGLLKFRKQKDHKHGRANICQQCYNKKQRKAWANPDDPKKASQLAKRYQCTAEEYNTRMASSDVCEVCGKDHDLVYDHCHDSMEFRGVLCRGCNRSIGQLGDNLESILKVVAYLTKV